jgi:hypothetical protein
VGRKPKLGFGCAKLEMLVGIPVEMPISSGIMNLNLELRD